MGKHSLCDASLAGIRNLIDRVVISRATIRIHLSEDADGGEGARILALPWTRPSLYRKREIIQGADDAKTYARPMPANARATLIEALREAHRWLHDYRRKLRKCRANPVDQEITPICADYLVELRGIEPLTSAVRLQRSPI